ncbi:MAG: MCE family protein [Bacteroidetes bacterium]|nr:MAG: MCE family protein [Bacteroidota bacterium]REK00046.1 MAG: MCE family protein [Bacteroidota bacterium]REK35773.1 MAG: MCE family protein [Bacteroidota bacterium]REK49354.1 MAG: MCE family protein [Bacteroidota bacterium]
MKFSKEVKTGFIVLSGILLAFWGINFLKGKDFFTDRIKVYAMYDRVDGLAPSNPVYVNGLKVGLVRKLELLPDFSGRIVVSLQLSKDVRIPRDSEAEIYATDLLGSKGIRINFGKGTDLLQDGDTMVTSIQNSLSEEVNAQVAPFKQKAESLLSSLDSVMLIVRAVFNEGTKQNLKNSFESISHSLRSIENIAGSMDTVLTKQGKLKSVFNNLESITTNLKNNNDRITDILENFHTISDTLARANIAATLHNLKETLGETSITFDKINKGEGTLGMLMNNDSLYVNLNNSARDLDFLLNDFQQNPKRYLKFSVISIGSGKNK